MNTIYKRIIELAVVLTGIACAASCTSILEKPQGSEVSTDVIFANRDYVESALFKVYYELVPKGFPYGTGDYKTTDLQDWKYFSRSILASITDECCNNSQSTGGWYVNNYGFDPESSLRNQEDSWAHRWPGIRAAWNFVMNIDSTPDKEISALEKEQMKAEAKTLVALAYMDMFPRYGGLPIVDHPLGDGDPTLLVQRATLQETIDFIIKLCDEALPNLPETVSSNWVGRITKGVALSIKARTLLYAASPLFNASSSVLPYDKPELICLGNYDKERWLAAAQASAEVLNWASKAGVSLIQASDISGGETDPKHSAYGYATTTRDNREIILANKGYGDDNKGFDSWIFAKMPDSGLSVLLNGIQLFRKADGSDQTWSESVNVRYPFSEYQTKIHEMEPRFYQCVWPVGDAAPNFSKAGEYEAWPYGKIDDNMGSADMFGAAPFVKFSYKYDDEMKDWIIFRLAEFYLNYAEAVNQYYGNPSSKTDNCSLTATEAVNVIRKRGGIRDLNSSETSNMDAFQQAIVRERGVELFAEGHRWFDCKRWKIADQTFGGTLYTLRYVQNVQGATATSYTDYYKVEHNKRAWTKAMYFYPFPQDEVDKGYLVQNPGY